ncbi:MAG: adenosylcobinamide-GDP ribazoletransferase, partial [Leptospirales bacterium]
MQSPTPNASIAGDDFLETLSVLLSGVVAAGACLAAQKIWPASISVLIALLALCFVGAPARRAQAGFARFCDGFGGGRERERILAILADANVGVFGAVGLTLMILLQHASLSGILAGAEVALPKAGLKFSAIVPALLIGQSLSHFFAAFLARSLPSLRGVDVPGGGPKKGEYLRPFFALPVPVACIAATDSLAFAHAVFPLIPLFILLRGVFKRRVGGVTADLRGAAHQIARGLYLITVLGLTGQ